MSNESFNTQITFRYIAPSEMQDCIISGVVGGVTPKGLISAKVFHETHALPDEETYNIKDGTLQEKTSLTTRPHMVRKIQSSMVMDLQTAISLRDWLSQRINELDSLVNLNKPTE